MAPLVVLTALLVAADMESLLAKVATYEHGANREALAGVTQLVTDSLAAPAQRKLVESRLLQFAESKATLAAREFALRELSRIGSAASIPRLRALLKQPEFAEMARYTIARISANAPSTRVNAASPKPDMQSKNPLERAAAIRLMSESPGPAVTLSLVELFPKLASRDRVVLLSALADRGDRSAAPLLVSTARTGEGDVRIAALSGLGKLGDASSVALLAEAAATGEGPQQAAARESLYSLRGAGIDDTIVTALRSASDQVKIELIMAAGERGIAAASSLLIAAVQERDSGVHREALRALRNVAGASDVPALLGLLLQATTASDRRESSQTLSSVLRRTDSARVAAVVAAYEANPPVDTRLALIDVMGQSSSDVALPLLRRLLPAPEPPIARAAILAISEWAAPTPMPDLLGLARTQQNPALQVLALRGYLRLIALPSERSPAATARLLGDAMQLARQAAEKRTILSLLSTFACKESLEVASAATKDRDVAKEASAAVDRLNGLLKFL